MLRKSPEHAMAQSMLNRLSTHFARLNPIEFQASSHITMSGDWDEDRAFLDIGYGYPNADVLEDGFQDLVEFFDESYYVLAPLLCEKWGVDDVDSIEWPVDESSSVTSYYTDADQVEYDTKIAKWLQESPVTHEEFDVLAVSLQPFDSHRSCIKLFFVDGKLFGAKAVNPHHEGTPDEAWEDGFDLTPDDVFFIQKLIRSIGPIKFDTPA